MHRLITPCFFLLITLLFTGQLAAQIPQILVNKAWQDTTGNPQDTLTLTLSAKDGANYVTVGNTYATSDSEQLLITKYYSTGVKAWQLKIASPISKRIIATDLNIKYPYIYIAAAAYDSALGTSSFETYKLKDTTGATVWTKQYNPTYSGAAVPAAVREDSLGAVYVAGTEQTGTADYEMTVLKMDTAGNVCGLPITTVLAFMMVP